MKICVIGTRGFPEVQGGVEKHCERLYSRMKSVEIIVFRRKPYVTETGDYGNIRFVDLISTRIKGFETVLHSFLATVCAACMKPDVVHFHNIGPALFSPIIKLCGIPVVLTYHSPNYEHKKWGIFAKGILRVAERVALKCADRIIFVNQFQKERYPQTVQQKSMYIPNGVEEPETPDNYDYLEKLGLEPGKYILSVGRLTPEKGFHTLISAYCASGIRDKKLVIAGGADHGSAYLEQLKELAGAHPVVFTGYVSGEHIAQLYACAAVYVLASENEGFPLVLLEAMSHGCRVLASDIPATHLVHLPEQSYFPAGDSMMLAEKLRKYNGKAERTDYDLSAFSWKIIAEQTMKVMAKACHKRENHEIFDHQ